MVRMLAVSDVHYEFKVFRGVNESVAFKWLLGVVERHRPDVLVSAGDWGEGLGARELDELLERTVVLTIYGNHDPVWLLKRYRNKLAKLSVLLKDGVPIEYQGLLVAGINGITSRSGRSKRGVPRKRPEEFVSVARRLAGVGYRVDLLLMHEVPALREAYPGLRVWEGTVAALEALRIVKPRLVVNGHLDWSCYTLHRIDWEWGGATLYLRVDSSQIHKCYAVVEWGEGKVTVYQDGEPLEEAEIPE